MVHTPLLKHTAMRVTARNRIWWHRILAVPRHHVHCGTVAPYRQHISSLGWPRDRNHNSRTSTNNMYTFGCTLQHQFNDWSRSSLLQACQQLGRQSDRHTSVWLLNLDARPMFFMARCDLDFTPTRTEAARRSRWGTQAPRRQSAQRRTHHGQDNWEIEGARYGSGSGRLSCSIVRHKAATNSAVS